MLTEFDTWKSVDYVCIGRSRWTVPGLLKTDWAVRKPIGPFDDKPVTLPGLKW